MTTACGQCRFFRPKSEGEYSQHHGWCTWKPPRSLRIWPVRDEGVNRTGSCSAGEPNMVGPVVAT